MHVDIKHLTSSVITQVASGLKYKKKHDSAHSDIVKLNLEFTPMLSLIMT